MVFEQILLSALNKKNTIMSKKYHFGHNSINDIRGKRD